MGGKVNSCGVYGVPLWHVKRTCSLMWTNRLHVNRLILSTPSSLTGFQGGFVTPVLSGMAWILKCGASGVRQSECE